MFAHECVWDNTLDFFFTNNKEKSVVLSLLLRNALFFIPVY